MNSLQFCTKNQLQQGEGQMFRSPKCGIIRTVAAASDAEYMHAVLFCHQEIEFLQSVSNLKFVEAHLSAAILL